MAIVRYRHLDHQLIASFLFMPWSLYLPRYQLIVKKSSEIQGMFFAIMIRGGEWGELEAYYGCQQGTRIISRYTSLSPLEPLPSIGWPTPPPGYADRTRRKGHGTSITSPGNPTTKRETSSSRGTLQPHLTHIHP